MSNASVISDDRRERDPEEIAAALRAEWRMIASVSLRPRSEEGEGLEADLRLDPIVVKGLLEQQRYPRTPEGMARIEARRLDAIARCIGAVNEKLRPTEEIRSFRVGDQRRSW